MFLSCIGLPTGSKCYKSEGVTHKLTNPLSTLTSFCSVKGVKRCKSSGVMEKLPPNFIHRFTPLDRPKICMNGELVCLLPPHSYTILSPLEAQCSSIRRKSFVLHFLRQSFPCSPTLTSYWAEKFDPGYCSSQFKLCIGKSSVDVSLISWLVFSYSCGK